MTNGTRNGKIARLPRAVREQLNQRLRDGEEGKKLVAWLNTLPELNDLVTNEFGGKAIRQQNLSEWKKGGYREWLAHQEAIEVAEKIAEDALHWDQKNEAPLTDRLSFWLASRYAIEISRIVEAKGRQRWRLLRQFCADIVELRRGDHSAQRLLLERQRMATQSLDADHKWKRKVIVALEVLSKYIEKHPQAKTAFDELVRQVRHPFDPRENPTQSSTITQAL